METGMQKEWDMQPGNDGTMWTWKQTGSQKHMDKYSKQYYFKLDLTGFCTSETHIANKPGITINNKLIFCCSNGYIAYLINSKSSSVIF